MAKILVGLLFVFVLQGVLGPRAEAQAPNCIIYISYCPTCGDPSYPGMHNCFVEYPFTNECELSAWWCPPSDAAAETCPTCSAIASGAAAGSPISLASGNTFIVERDIQIPGLGGGLSLTRQWNSMWPAQDSAYQTGIFGPNWRSTYEEQIFVGNDNYVKWLRGDGSIWSFGYGARFGSTSMGEMSVAAPATSGASGGGGSTMSKAGGRVKHLDVSPNSYIMYFADGSYRVFSLISGKLTGIVDRNGNATGIDYDSNGRLSSVHDPAGRHLYFNYGPSLYLCSSVTSDFGVSLSYSYDTQGRLTQITEPDSTTISFQYNSLSQITSVLDSNGHVLETHTYDTSGRGLSSSQANGVNAVTVNY